MHITYFLLHNIIHIKLHYYYKQTKLYFKTDYVGKLFVHLNIVSFIKKSNNNINSFPT